ncbi:MAG: hypothetical protein ACRELV_05485 [Longimicrobiales bacterium]
MRPIQFRQIRAALAALALTVVATAACASMRGVEVQSEPGPVYTVEITNTASYAMRVSYDDGAGAQLLGSIEPGESATFVITSPARTTVTIRATDEGGGREIRRTVTLQRGGSSRVVLSG